MRAPDGPPDIGSGATVVAPLAILAGSYATIAMLLAADAPAFLAQQHVRYLLVRADGSVVCDTVSPDHGVRVVVAEQGRIATG